MRAELITNVGLVRKNNEDAALSDLQKGLFAVADGMGGYVAGEVASVLAIESLQQSLAAAYEEPVLGDCKEGDLSQDSPEEIIRQAFYRANDCIFQEAKDNKAFSGMGTTLSVLWILDEKAYLTHVGDSRIYLIRQGEIELLTRDHSLVGELMREGEITEEEAKHHPQRNLITRALGNNALVEVDTLVVPVVAGDYFLLCTDGLSNLASNQEILDIVTSAPNDQGLKESLSQLVELALERGGSDNITAILVHY